METLQRPTRSPRRNLKDKLGRVKFTTHTQNPTRSFDPDHAQVAWLRFINLHGMASSELLYQYTKDVRGVRNRQNCADKLKALFDGQLVYKPIGQRYTEQPDGNYHVYALTEKGKTYLKKQELWVPALRPGGNHWLHQFMIASFTGTIHVMCERAGFRYIPPHEYLNGNSPTLKNVPFEWDGTPREKNVTPDAIFAIDYGDKSIIAYALEADRDTEAGRATSWEEKSGLRSVRQYYTIIKKKLYHAYGRRVPLVMLYLTVNQGNAATMLDIIKEEIGTYAYMAVSYDEHFITPFKVPKLQTYLFDEGWHRSGKDPWVIGKLDT